MKNLNVLYGNGSFGIKEWKIWSDGNVIYIAANGSIHTETINEGKAGRSIEEQIKLRINARVRSKLDHGFKRTKEELLVGNTNQLGLPLPMLAHAPSNSELIRIDKSECYIQPKLNGHRCLIGEDGAYSRKGKEIDSIKEIIKSLPIPHGLIYDGELYCHGVPLQRISSWVKRRQKDTLNLQFHIYDVIAPGLQYKERLEVIRRSVKENEYVRLVETEEYDTNINVFDYWMEYKNSGYEGGILRPFEGMYEVGKRSRDLIKIKSRFDAEFECIDIVPSRDGYGILVLKTKEGKEFKTFAPGTYYDKMSALRNKERYIGKLVTVEYAELTEDNVPFHCVATGWRTDL